MSDDARIGIWRRFRIEIASHRAERRAAKFLKPMLDDNLPMIFPSLRSLDRKVRQTAFRHVRSFMNCEPS